MQIEIFHYEPDKKFYLRSELIEDQHPGVGFPAYSTDVAPPFDSVQEGTIPVFNGTSWDIVVDSFWRPKIVQIGYDAGRDTESYTPIHLSMYSGHFPQYPSMPQLCNTFLVTQSIIQRVRFIHEKFSLISELQDRVKSNDLYGVLVDSPNYEALASLPSTLSRHKFEIETMVYLMRRVLDNLVQLSYLLTNYSDFDRTKIIAYNEIGKFAKKESATTDIEKIIVGDGMTYEQDNTRFLEVINDLFNSFKHCLMHDESNSMIGLETPIVTSFQAKNNNYNNEIVHHIHSMHHIMMGFQDSVLRILRNQKVYLSEN